MPFLIEYLFQAIVSRDGLLLDRSAGGIRGRSLRVCSVVDNEMDLVAASPYSDRVRVATKVLRESGPYFAQLTHVCN